MLSIRVRDVRDSTAYMLRDVKILSASNGGQSLAFVLGYCS